MKIPINNVTFYLGLILLVQVAALSSGPTKSTKSRTNSPRNLTSSPATVHPNGIYGKDEAGGSDNSLMLDMLRNETLRYMDSRNTSLVEIYKERSEAGSFPVVFNLATGADISTNATCGEVFAESYCKLVNHVKRRPTERIQCGVCDPNSLDPWNHHPVTNAIDGSNHWWQSPTITSGTHYNYVTITLDLKQVYQVAYIIVQAANSPRPGNWILERSLDGVVYTPWQYFALTDSDCWNTYGLPPTIGIPKFQTDDQVICTSDYSRLDPLENGEIHTSLINHRPGADGPSAALLEFTRARYVRLRLQRIRTLNADLMSFVYSSHNNLDPSVTNRYYYSIKDIWIGGQCVCHGHSSSCPSDPDTGELRCDCEDNTCGATCEQCCPMFNQKKWGPGSYIRASICEECNCFGHATSCVYNQTVDERGMSLNFKGEYSGGGVCTDCQHHTMGINCELCMDGYYRPGEVAHYRVDACHACLCDGPGTSGLCVKDSTMQHLNIFAGDCFCLEGYCGPRCEECSPGYHGYPDCQPCLCSIPGSLNVDICEEECSCKAFTWGESCGECVPGYYNMLVENPDGCMPCFCFGVTDQCHSSTWGSTQLTELAEWTLTDLADSAEVTPVIDDFSLYVYTANLTMLNRAIYWKASEEFTGNMLGTYGGMLEYEFCYSTNLTATDVIPGEEHYVANYDVILEGGGLRMGHSGRYYEPDGVQVVILPMYEDGWYHLDHSVSQQQQQDPVTRQDLMTLLANVDRFLIRATYSMHQTQTSLLGVRLDMASETGILGGLSSVEVCECPQGYSGSSCQDCAPGFRRVDNFLFAGTCEPCQCHGHSMTCDSFTGECISCEHDTQGAHCEECAFGYHGNSTIGTPDACQQCACPLDLPSNNFARGCVTSTSQDSGYICIDCFEGYQGEFCDLCAAGFYGNPLLPGNYCKPCDCHGNVDLTLIELVCDRFSGECGECLGHTEGFYCDTCQHGYYGTADDQDCTPCGCNVYGSIEANCDNISGMCRCKSRYTGRDCGQCEVDYGNIAAGCVQCNCSSLGSLGTDCDPVTGQCPCWPGVGGLHCASCLPDHYHYSSTGCTACGCSQTGAVSAICDDQTGQCMCKENVAGTTCRYCRADHWGLSSGEGCVPCECNTTGSVTGQCDILTGQCRCQPGVTGHLCDHCDDGYYAFTSNGCQKCDECTSLGHVCDPESGQCVCPHNTEGDSCEACVHNAWGYHPQHGCQVCECNSTGSDGVDCDQITGQCPCKSNYAGRACDRCEFGHHGFPHCRPCHCHVEGTVDEVCDDRGHCQCDEDGQCPCKENVMGTKCDRCKDQTFSLQHGHHKGCTRCFCFGKTDDCDQSDYVWSTLSVPDAEVIVHEGEKESLMSTSQGWLVIPDGLEDVFISPHDRNKPLYWALPSQVLGDKTSSYNGILSYDIEVGYIEEGSTSHTEVDQADTVTPLIQISGSYYIRLQHQKKEVETSTKQHHQILLREDMFQEEYGLGASRGLMMVLLQNTQSIIIKISNTASIRYARLSKLSIQQAVKQGGTDQALGVEQCYCPPQYTGLSCQDAGSGYFKEIPTDLPSPFEPLELVGYVMPCMCHNHSNQCDRETGQCFNCEHHTTGWYCDECIDGYHGNPINKSPSDCQICACPFLYPSSFSETCYDTSDGDYVCDACSEGYVGNKCEICAPGYYGNVSTPDSRCTSCSCNPEGSLSPVCDRLTGECLCVTGVTGQRCDQCQPRHALVEGQCESCEIGCTGILMEDLDKLEIDIKAINTSASAYLPWKLVDDLTKNTAEYQRQLDIMNVSAVSHVLSNAKAKQHSAHRLADRSSKIADKANSLMSTEESTVTEKVKKVLKEATSTDTKFRDFVKGYESDVRSLLTNQTGGVDNLTQALVEAEAMLDELKMTDMLLNKQQADNSSKAGRESLEEMQTLSETHQTDISSVRERMLEHVMKANDIDSNVFGDVIDMVDDVMMQTATIDEGIYILNGQIDDAQSMKKDIWTSLQDGESTNVFASHLLQNETKDNYQKVADLLKELSQAKTELEAASGLLKQNIPPVHLKTKQAYDKAENLLRQANQLANQFSDTQLAAEDPMRAARAYDNMKAVIEEADAAVTLASMEASNAYDKVFNTSAGPLHEQAAQTLTVSENLQQQSAIQQHNATENKPKQTAQQILLEELEEKHKITKEEVMIINDRLPNKTSAIPQTTRDLSYKTAATMFSAQSITDRAKQIENIADQQMQKKIDAIRNERLQSVTQTKASVITAQDEILKIQNITARLEKKVQDGKEMESKITANIMMLKEKIKQARAQADSIKVSMYHDGGCVRMYDPPTDPSTSNTVSLHFKTNGLPAQDQMIFLLRTQDDYLAVELVDGRVVFSWYIGGAGRALTHPLEIMAATDDNKDNQIHWYLVEAERVGRQGRLRVSSLSATEPAEEVTTESDHPSVTMTMDETTEVYVAGLPDDYNLPGSLTSRTFKGCVGQVRLDGKHIGLFNFRSLQGDGCEGCQPVPSVPEENGLYQFDGYGYAGIHTNRYSDYEFGVKMKIKSYWEDALLFFAKDDISGDYMGVILRDGHVEFHYSFGGMSTARARTSGVYNTNTWTSIRAQRQGLRGVLEVNDEQLFVDAVDPGQETLSLENSTYYFAGVPQHIDVLQHDLVNVSFLGCMKDAAVITKGTTYVNLLDGLHVGMTTGCSWLPREVGMRGGGHLVVDSPELPAEGSDISVTFRTTQMDTLFLLSTTDTSQMFFSLSLLAGELEFWMDAGSGFFSLRSAGPLYNDGVYHTVYVKKTTDNVDLYVDDILTNSGTLPSSSGAIPMISSGLYIGGLPPGMTAENKAASWVALKGCIKDVAVNGRLLRLDAPTSYVGADVGRCHVESLFPNLTSAITERPTSTDIPIFTVTVDLPTTTPVMTTTQTTTTQYMSTETPISCAEEGKYEYLDDAISFGAVPHSHAELIIKRRAVNKDFQISVELRTFKERGLIFYITNEAQTEYIAVQMVDGHLNISYAARGTMSGFISELPLNDGIWHTISVTKNRKEITLQIDSNSPSIDMIPRKIDVIAPVYVGGLPPVYQPREGLVSHSFQGCMRNFYLNSQAVDLANSKSVMGISPCYRRVEKGAYLDGLNYAMYAERYRIKSEFSVKLDFRTTKTNGVLISLSDYTGVPSLGLVLLDGKLVFTVVTGSGQYAVESDVCPHCLCDNRWHSVSAVFMKNLLMLSVDNTKTRIGGSQEEDDLGLDVNTELFIGGFPRWALPQTSAPTKDKFRGCMKNLYINGTETDWQLMDELVDIYVGACPLSETTS